MISIGRSSMIRLRAKEDAYPAAASNHIVANKVVCIAVANRDAGRPALFNHVFFRQAEFDAPAEEKPDIVVLDPIVADDGPLRTRSRMHAEPGVIVTVAVLGSHVVANLPANAVAVVVAGGHAANRHA